MQADYINDLLCGCAPYNRFSQNAIEYAILSGNVLLSFNYEADRNQLMTLYDEIIDKYREVQSRHAESLNDFTKKANAKEVFADS